MMKKWFKKCKQYIIGSVITIIILLLFWVISLFIKNGWRDFANWLSTEHGNVADWASGLGTIFALIAVVWQQGRQENLERAINVEKSRPRFSLSFYPTVENNTTILYWNKDPQDVKNMVKNGGVYRFISIENISENMVYDFYAILKYHEAQTFKPRTDYWKTEGVSPKEKVVMIPKFKGTEVEKSANIIYDSLTIKFVTTANEVGFFSTININGDSTDNSFGNARYFYVRGKHIKHVTAVNRDRMIKVNSDKCRSLDNMFDSISGSTNFMEVDNDGEIH